MKDLVRMNKVFFVSINILLKKSSASASSRKRVEKASSFSSSSFSQKKMFGLRHSPRPLPFFHSLFSFFSYTKQKKKGLILTIFLISSHFNFFSFSPFSLSFLLREMWFSFPSLFLWEGENAVYSVGSDRPHRRGYGFGHLSEQGKSINVKKL
jgi:hypothetical protein